MTPVPFNKPEQGSWLALALTRWTIVSKTEIKSQTSSLSGRYATVEAMALR
jgi:hypothetical protein